MTKKIILKRTSSVLLSLLLLAIMVVPVMAQVDFGTEYTDIGLPDQDIRTVISNIIKVLLGFLGIVALVIILIGGVEWMTAGGSEDKVKSAQKRIGYGIIGLVVIFVAYAITLFVFDVLYREAGGI